MAKAAPVKKATPATPAKKVLTKKVAVKKAATKTVKPTETETTEPKEKLFSVEVKPMKNSDHFAVYINGKEKTGSMGTETTCNSNADAIREKMQAQLDIYLSKEINHDEAIQLVNADY